MLRLLLVLILLPISAQAKPAKWWDIDCDKMPIQIVGEFNCKAGKAIPADDLRLYHATRDTQTEFLRYYLMAIDGMRYFLPLSGKDLIQEFEEIEPWSRGATWTAVTPVNNGMYASAQKEDWSCLFHRSLNDQKWGGYRHALYLSYCKRGGSVSSDKVGELLKQIRD